MFSKRTIYEIDSDFDHYAIVEQQYEGRPARVLFSGGRQAAQSGIGLDDNPDLLFDYNQRMLEIANALYPKRILVLGGGAFTLPMALHAALPDASIDVVELDDQLALLATDYFGLRLDERLRVQFGDGRELLAAGSPASYDLIVVDVYSQLAIPYQFLTLEFAAAIRKALRDNGTVVVNLIARYEGRGSDLIKHQVAAYRSLFPSVEIFPAAYGLSTWLPQNLVLTAQLQPLDDLKDYVRFAPLAPLTVDDTMVWHDDDNAPVQAV